MDDKLYSKEYRHKYLKQLKYEQLNKYLWNIEKLSKKKGGVYTKMYNEDIDFILNSTSQSGGFFLSLFEDSNPNNNNLKIENTEQCVKNLNLVFEDIQENTLCAKCIDKTNSCPHKIADLKLIKKVLKISTNVEQIKDAMKRFIDVIFCCGEDLVKPVYKINVDNYIPKIMQRMLSKPKYLDEICTYIDRIKLKEPNKIYIDYVNEFIDLNDDNEINNLKSKYKDDAKLLCSHIVANIYKQRNNNIKIVENTRKKLNKI